MKRGIIHDNHSIEVRCPYCETDKVVKYGKGKTGAQRYKCMNEKCRRKIFQLAYVKVEMAVNGSGTRDTGRVLKISLNTVTSVLKNRKICGTCK